jgi:hypothetical protein
MNRGPPDLTNCQCDPDPLPACSDKLHAYSLSTDLGARSIDASPFLNRTQYLQTNPFGPSKVGSAYFPTCTFFCRSLISIEIDYFPMVLILTKITPLL